jgi:multidrug efflux pump subunit AcrA (membrane-fusion protein)
VSKNFFCFLWVGIVASLGLCTASCTGPDDAEAKKEDNRPTVAVSKTSRDDLSRGWSLAAGFRPYQEVDVHAKVAGYMNAIYVDVGDRVRTGQVLATLEIPELKQELQQAAAAVKRSEAEATHAQNEIERSESAHNAVHSSYVRLAAVLESRPNLVAQQEIDDAQARDRVGEAQIAAAKSALAAAQEQVLVSKANMDRIQALLDYSRITAPFSGVITKRYADTGAMIQAGTASQTQAMPVVRLSQNDRLRLVLPVPESIIPRVRIGSAVEVKVPTLDRTFEGRVARFTGKLDTATRTMDTEVDVPNPQLILMPGMYAYATLTIERRERALSVPVMAVSSRDNRTTLMVVNSQNQLEERIVTVGIETPNKVEILSGLKEEELVVVGSRAQFKSGERVTPKVVQIADAKEEH